MMSKSKKCFMGFLLLTTCAFLAQAAGVLEPVSSASLPTDQYIENNVEKDNDMLTVHKRPAFFVGSRYGRSGKSGNTPKARRLIVVPRNDRFFLGSRYGKRAENYAGAHLDNENQNKVVTNAANRPNYMTCSYIGIGNYYRCNNVDGFDNVINQLSSPHNLAADAAVLDGEENM